MALTYQQTSNIAGCGAISACSTHNAPADADGITATTGGTGSTTQLACDIAAGSTEACFMTEISPTTDTDWNSGNWTVRMNITDSKMDLNWESIYICHLGSTCDTISTLGVSSTFSQNLGAGGVFSQTVSASSVGSPSTGDKVYLVFGVNNTHSMNTRTLGVTPDQNIDSPFTRAASTAAQGPPGSGSYNRRLKRQVMS